MSEPQQHDISTSDLLLEHFDNFQGEHILVQDVIHVLSQRAFGLVLLFFALPNCIPLPPGFSSLISSPLIFFGIQMMLGKQEPWLPHKVKERPLPREVFLKIIRFIAKILHRMERWTHPRLEWLTETQAERWLGFFVMIFGVSIAIPLPFTNFIPAFGVAFMSIGLLERDGILIIIGLLIGLFGMAVTTSILFSLGFLTVWIFS